jgi:hypothetical protein
MRSVRAVLFATLAALVPAACDGPSGSVAVTADTAKSPSSAGAPAPPRDDTPPAWLPPPDYTEIAWPRASDLIRTRAADRVISTQTRRAYLSTPTGEKYFTIEPRHGDMKTLALAVQAATGPLMYREYDEIPWKEAEEHIRNKRVSSVGTAHFQVVSLTLRGGGYFFTIAPKSAEVVKLVRQVDPSIDVTVE